MLPEMYVLKIYVHPYSAENYFIASDTPFLSHEFKAIGWATEVE